LEQANAKGSIWSADLGCLGFEWQPENPVNSTSWAMKKEPLGCLGYIGDEHTTQKKKIQDYNHTIPIPSMYGIHTYIWLILMVNVGKYTIHGSYGIYKDPYKPTSI